MKQEFKTKDKIVACFFVLWFAFLLNGCAEKEPEFQLGLPEVPEEEVMSKPLCEFESTINSPHWQKLEPYDVGLYGLWDRPAWHRLEITKITKISDCDCGDVEFELEGSRNDEGIVRSKENPQDILLYFELQDDLTWRFTSDVPYKIKIDFKTFYLDECEEEIDDKKCGVLTFYQGNEVKGFVNVLRVKDYRVYLDREQDSLSSVFYGYDLFEFEKHDCKGFVNLSYDINNPCIKAREKTLQDLSCEDLFVLAHQGNYKGVFYPTIKSYERYDGEVLFKIMQKNCFKGVE